MPATLLCLVLVGSCVLLHYETLRWLNDLLTRVGSSPIAPRFWWPRR